MFIRGLAGADRKSRGAGLMRALLACCLAGMAMGLTGEAPWGNAWSDSAGVLATSFAPLSIFYTCSVRDLTYTTLAACNAACEMGRCYMRQEMPTVPSITPPATASGMSVSKMAPGIMIGQRLEMIVQGAAGSNMVNISVMEDPGLPVGMSYEWLNPQGTQLKLVWMPRSTQFGKIHELVVTGKQGGVSAYPWRVQIPVIGPSFEWAKPGEEGETVTAVVGSPTSVELRCNSNYLSEIVVAEGHNLANGMVLAATSPVSRLYVDGQLGDYPVATSNIIYTPPTGSDGTTDTACFDCKVMGESKRRCVTFEVELCKYTVKDGDSLTSISRNVRTLLACQCTRDYPLMLKHRRACDLSAKNAPKQQNKETPQNIPPHPALHYSSYSTRRLLKITQFEQQQLSCQSNSASGFDFSFFGGGVL